MKLLRTVGVMALAASASVALAAGDDILWPFDTQFPAGLYTTRSLDTRTPAPVRKICLRSAAELVYLMQGNSQCESELVQSSSDRLTVNYSCTGRAAGRTEVLRETPDLYRVESQGFNGNLPFADRIELRRIGNCPSGPSNIVRR